MGVPISMLRCRWFTEEEIETWMRQDSKPQIYGTSGTLCYRDYVKKLMLNQSHKTLDERHCGKLICFEKVKDGRISRTQYVDRIDESVLSSSSTKNLFGRAFLNMNPKFYPLGVHRHEKYGKCLISAPAKILTVSLRIDGVLQRLCRQHGHTYHIPESFFSWVVTDENELLTIDIPFWNPEIIAETADILKCDQTSPTPSFNTPSTTPSGTPRGTPRSTGRLSRKGRWVNNLSHGNACAKAFHDFMKSLPSGLYEVDVDVGFMYSCDDLLLLPLEKEYCGEGGHVWKRDTVRGEELLTVDMSKESVLLAYPLKLATGTIKMHKS